MDYIKQKDPDILALEEINTQWITKLKPVLEQYPHYQEIPRKDNFGIVLYSKFKPKNMLTKYYGTIEVPSIVAEYQFQEEPITLLFTHPVPPGTEQYFKWRNEQLQDIIDNRSAFSKKMILIGDLNTTSWSYTFQNFVKKMNLIDTRKGFGLQTTWPSMLPLMRITIDHILVSEKIQTTKREVGPHIGSDHYPVYIEVMF
ncbi:MAG: endonuclease/exonuclease/phosphatase family protein [Candidatus Omnitrophica bacterium]|nr:endonuclease/exonuclease/phosphatase family protein [Candidatus Omnitrophota bacterium]